jgi:hypothetical protein
MFFGYDVFLGSRHCALRLPGSCVAPVKVFESHSVTVFVKDELNNSAEEALIKAFSLEWGMAYLRGVGIADGEGKFRFVRK